MSKYPDGKLLPDDEGAIPMKVGIQDGRVVIVFPKPIAWLGLTGDGALELAAALIEKGRAAGTTQPFTLTLGRTPAPSRQRIAAVQHLTKDWATMPELIAEIARLRKLVGEDDAAKERVEPKPKE